MFNYSKRIEAFRDQKVRLPEEFKKKLLEHRKSNRNRLIVRLPGRIEGLRISESSFKPQGSVAVNLIIQTKFKLEEYDIDDGLVLWRDDLVDEDGNELSADEVREHVRQALKDKRFAKQPRLFTNAVRVYYKESDEEKHHVDFPVYRKYFDANDDLVRELASEGEWIVSDPTQVNDWYLGEVQERNASESGRGTQMRHDTQLLKRFCRSRYNWDMPNGMKLTMLVAECQPVYNERIDIAFRNLLEALDDRLRVGKIICNLAHPDRPPITKTNSDSNVEDFHEAVQDALERLKTLDDPEADNAESAREVWDWIFQTDGFFKEFDDEENKKEKALAQKAALLSNGVARTTAAGTIGLSGIANAKHRFYAGTFRDRGKPSADYRHFVAQKLLIEKHFPVFTSNLKKGQLRCEGVLQPADGCASYNVQIEHHKNGIPKVRVLSPFILPSTKIHMYEDGSLCLYYPPEDPWRRSDNIHEKIIPWIAEWLVYYELFLIHGKWLGPEAPHVDEEKMPQK